MICSETAMQRLEYPRLKGLLAGQTQSEPGRLSAEQLQPLSAQVDIEAALTEVDEAVQCLNDGQAPSLGGCWDLTELLGQVRAEGSLIATEELLKVVQSLRVMEDCRLWFKTQSQDLSLATLAFNITPLAELQRRLQDSIGSRGELLDSASFVLGDLRYQIRQTRSRIKQQLDQLLTGEHSSSLFQERLITIRNNRYVVPLKSDCRGQLKGFVQDESASGQTLYLEPSQVLEGNNRLQQLAREEQREERRILLELAGLVRRDTPVLQNNQKTLARIDLRFAAGRLSRGYQGCRPELASDSVIELKQARHPLLMEIDGRFDHDAAVGIDVLLGKDCHALVISGPNTGGKSVALKTLGLQLLMLRSGLHVPCHPESRLHLYQHLHVDIGDQQSIAQSLSTFSGHLLKMREILEQADAETLVLLDEAGTGTDPAEGAALVQAVLDQLCQQGAKTLLTTHLGQLKHFAHGQPAIENAAVEFDPETLAPTYRLRYGIPGASSALTTAKRLGLPQHVLQRAVQYLGQEEHDHSALLIKLNRRQQELDQELVLTKRLRLEADSAQQLRKQQLQQLKEKKKEILARATRQADELIAATESRMKVLRRSKPGTVSPQQAIDEKQQFSAARADLSPYRPKLKRSGSVPVQLTVGELVRISALGVEAQVERIQGAEIDLLVGGKRMRQSLEALEQFSPRRFVASSSGGGQVSRSMVDRQIRPEIKLIGQRVDEAMAQLGRFIDDAMLNNLQKIEIIHGSGEGILRRAVREHLAAEAGVTAFYAAPIAQGGDNITIVELRD
ncbi:DNA mismatch repair protein MutS2 [Desulfuromusa kysingii]|uniref:Endonuclease MutS2 n=2 Tax=Desulfuromusa kysingii TaxID=37625 RepID=A0A1H3XCJ4_9BACT|nr:DNA mismatch repair protein MutS2 [Desulfuromusa kysingii]